jgi:hypothetical protein
LVLSGLINSKQQQVICSAGGLLLFLGNENHRIFENIKHKRRVWIKKNLDLPKNNRPYEKTCSLCLLVVFAMRFAVRYFGLYHR